MGFLYRAVITAAVLVAGMAGPAMADVDVSPYKVEAGDSLRIAVDLDDECDDGSDIIAESEAFDEDGVELDPRGDDEAVGWADIDWDADPGRYDVEVTCDDEYLDSGTFVVVGNWGPDTGGGGLALTAQERAAATVSEPQDTGHGVLFAGGAIMVLLAGGVVAWSVAAGRRRSRSRA